MQSAIANINYINISLKQSVWHTDRVNRRGKNYSQQINMLSGAAFLNTNASTASCITSVCDNVDAITFHRGICKSRLNHVFFLSNGPLMIQCSINMYTKNKSCHYTAFLHSYMDVL